MHLKIVIALLAFIPTYSALAADNLLSMQQKYGFKMCQKITPKIKKKSQLICSVKDYKEYLKDRFYDCVLTNKKMDLKVMSHQGRVSDITFSKIFNDTDYGYGIGGKSITPDTVKDRLTKYGLKWSEARKNDGSTEIDFGKTYTSDVESFVQGMVDTNSVLLPKGVPKHRGLTENERKTTKYYVDFDGLCGDFALGFTYQFDANKVIKEIKFSSAIP
jgi:hypothetical protein